MRVEYDSADDTVVLYIPGPGGDQALRLRDPVGLWSMLKKATPNVRLGEPGRPTQAQLDLTTELVRRVNERCDAEKAERVSAAKAFLEDLGL